MIDTQLCGFFQKVLVVPVARYIHNTRTTPTTITLASLISGVLAVPFIAFGNVFFSLFFLLLSGYLDNLDGALARLIGSQSKSGAVLDMTSDRLVEISILLGLYSFAPQSRALVCLFILSGMFLCITSFFLGAIFSDTSSKDKSFHYSPGIIERTETFVFFVLVILFPTTFNWLGSLFALLVLATAGLRISKLLKNLYYEEL